MRGRLQFGLKMSEIKQTRRPGKLVNHQIQLKKSPFDSFFARSGERRFEG